MTGRRPPIPPGAAAAADRIGAILKGNPGAAERLSSFLEGKVAAEKAGGDSDEGPAEVVRRAIRESGLSLGELERRTGVKASTLSRFMNDENGISLATFAQLAPELGLRIVASRRRKRS